MARKLSSILLCFIIIHIACFDMEYVAAEKNVTDCIGLDADCSDEFEQPGEELEATDEESAKPASVVFNFIKMILALLLVLALIYFILNFMKKRNKLFQQTRMLENLGGVSVGQNKSVQLIRIGERVYMIGVGENVEMLEEVKDEELKQALLSEMEQNEEPHSFLQHMFKNKSVKMPDDEFKKKENRFTTAFQNELNKLKQNRSGFIDKFGKKDE